MTNPKINTIDDIINSENNFIMFFHDSRTKGYHERTLSSSDHPTIEKLWAKSVPMEASRHELQSMYIRWPWAIVIGDALTYDIILPLYWELSNGKDRIPVFLKLCKYASDVR